MSVKVMLACKTLVIILALTKTVFAHDCQRLVGETLLTYDADKGLFLTSAQQFEEERPTKLSSEIGIGLPLTMMKEMKSVTEGDGLKLYFDQSTTLELQPSGRAGECTNVIWSTQTLTELVDCIDYGTAEWYGAFEQREQLWPVQKVVKSNYTFVTKAIDNMGIAERLWINTDGLLFYVEPYVPLFIDANATGDNKLCFIAKFEDPYTAVTELRLHYQVCTYQDARDAHEMSLTTVLNAVKTELPDERMIRDPIWSTWARYKKFINESVILNFAQEIIDHGYANSQLEIDDGWETCYGELSFDTQKFPDPAGLVNTLKSMGYRVTIWIHPFVNEDCPSFITYKNAGYFAKDANGNTRTTWWNGLQAGIIDFSNSTTVDWFLNRMRILQNIGIDSFKFDAGETSWLPQKSVLSGDPSLQPILYTHEYVKSFMEFIPLAEVRVGFQTQNQSIFVRMVDKDSNWSWKNGLKTIVTTLLAMNTAGYSYILPDMIGGNGYGMNVTAELFVRWLQATTFMPALQFSYVPWDFNDVQIEDICSRYVDLHAQYTGIIMSIANSSLQSGKPINKPLAYTYSATQDQLQIDDQYMLGDKILVAPVLEEGATSRDIYLPPGVWTDMNTGLTIVGDVWLRDYPAPLDTLPYFENQIVSGSARLYISIVTILVAITSIILVL